MVRLLLTLLGILTLAFPAAAADADGPLVIAHVNVVDVARGGVQRDMTVVIRDGKIAELRKARRVEKAPTGATLLDARGQFLIPGLWDMHAHIAAPERELPLLIANGVLGIRDVGAVPEKIFAWRAQTARGERLGPRIVACGPIVDGPEPSNPPLSVVVKDADDARAMAHKLATMGADCVKVHDRVPRDAYLALADETRKLGLPLVGHIPVRVPTREATDAGQRSLEHQIGLRGTSSAEAAVMAEEQASNVMAEAMRTQNFSLIPESIAQRGNRLLDHFQPKRAAELYAAFARNGTYLDPTLVTLHALTFVDDLSRRDDPRAKYIPAATRDYWRPERGFLTRYRTPAYIAYRKREYAKTLEQIPVAQRAGVRFLAGTDMSLPYVYPGFSLHDELAHFVEAGLTPLEALRTATLNPAKLLRLETGSIARGKAADLVLLEADPLAGIANTKKILAVVVKGRLLHRAELDALLAKAAAEAAKP